MEVEIFFFAPVFAMAAIGLYCACQTYFDIRRRHYLMAIAGGLSAIFTIGYVFLVTPTLLHPGIR
jgi:hypothetical protein